MALPPGYFLCLTGDRGRWMWPSDCLRHAGVFGARAPDGVVSLGQRKTSRFSASGHGKAGSGAAASLHRKARLDADCVSLAEDVRQVRREPVQDSGWPPGGPVAGRKNRDGWPVPDCRRPVRMLETFVYHDNP